MFLIQVSIARKISRLSLFSLLIWLLNDLILYSFVLQQHHGPVKHVEILKSLLIMPRRTSTAQDTARDCFWHATKVKLPSYQADLRGETHYMGSTACKPGKPNKLNPAIPKTVWKTSTMSPGLSAMPPLSRSWKRSNMLNERGTSSNLPGIAR